ncbi:MAG TPA: PIN domain-containing protein [Polyangiaceae bacterium]
MIAPYLDASAIIYLVEGTAIARARVGQCAVLAEQDPAGRILTSQLARLECRVKPLRDGNAALLATYDGFFTRTRLELVDVSAPAIDRATELRARYGFKTRDAIARSWPAPTAS